MRALPFAVFPTIIVLATSMGLFGRWLSAPAADGEWPPSTAISLAVDVPRPDQDYESRADSPPISAPPAAINSPPPSEVPVASLPKSSDTSDRWTEARWRSLVNRERARFSIHAIHVEDHGKSVELHHRMLANQRRFHDTMQSSDMHGDLKRSQIATDSRERELNSTIENFQAGTALFEQLVAVGETAPVESDRFVSLLTAAGGKCAVAGDAFELATKKWAAARDSEGRTFIRISKIYEQKKNSEAIAASSRHRTARGLGEDAQFEAKWAARKAASYRETIQTYRSFQVLKVDGELQKVVNLAMQNEKLAGELEAMARTLFQSTRMSGTDLERHRKTVQELSKKVDANEAAIDRALAAMKFH